FKTMKILVFILSMGIASCQGQSKTTGKEKTMQKQEIIQLVQDNKVTEVDKALKNGADVNTQDANGRSLLLLATVNNQEEMAKLLVDNGADVNKQAQNKESPFLSAGANGQTALVQLYLENGARFDVFNRYYGSALIPACERGHVETAKLLINTKDYPIDHVNRLG